MSRLFRFAILLFLVFLLVFNVFYTRNGFSGGMLLPKKGFPTRQKRIFSNGSSEPPTDSRIEGMDRFDWYAMKMNKTPRTSENISTLYAYEFEHEITVTVTSWEREKFRVYCRYVDENGEEIGKPFESFTFPEYIVNCRKRDGTRKIGLSVEEFGDFEPVPLVDRMMKEPKFELSMCVAPLYGFEPKWLMFIEMVEHYKLQGVQHFYLHIHKANNYDLRVVNEYVRTGEVEVHYLLERDERADNHWHMVNIADCLIWSRAESKWTIFADLDERILMSDGNGRILDYMRGIEDEKVAGVQFRQQWVLKTELMPSKYEGDVQVEAWMPTHRWHNSSGYGSSGHTAKCIIDSAKVFSMFIHYVIEYFPGNDYFLEDIGPEDGIIRHYRDQTLGNWGKKWLKETLEFGALRHTDYPSKYLATLTENVKRKAKYVYDNESE